MHFFFFGIIVCEDISAIFEKKNILKSDEIIDRNLISIL